MTVSKDHLPPMPANAAPREPGSAVELPAIKLVPDEQIIVQASTKK